MSHNGIMRTVLYARVSTDDGRQDTENQLAELRDYAHQQGWEVTGEYIDYASGKNGKRPEFKRLFADAAAHCFDRVAFWALDRFSREGVLKTFEYLAELKKHGVCFTSCKEEFIDTCGPLRDVVISLFATMAAMERQRISDRTKVGLTQARARGAVLGHRSRIDPVAVRQMLVAGRTQASIATELGVSVKSIQRALARV